MKRLYLSNAYPANDKRELHESMAQRLQMAGNRAFIVKIAHCFG